MIKNRRDIIIFSFIIIAVTILKVPYVRSIINFMSNQYFCKLFVLNGNEQIANLIWLIPIVSTVFFISKQSYLCIMNFEVRYKNRKKYFYKLIKDHSIKIIFYNILAILIQYISICFMMNIPIAINGLSVQFIIKYFIELGVFSLTILLISILLKNFIYGFLINISLLCLAMLSLNNSFVPVVSLYMDSYINLYSIISIFILIFLIRKVYTRLDLIGGKNK